MKPGKILISCLLLLLSDSIAQSQSADSAPAAEKIEHARVDDAIFHSASLNCDMHYLVLLPRDYAGGRRFPVLYLLHGLYGDYKNWDTRTRLERAAESLSLLIVMPEAGDSWYINSATKPTDRFEDYIVKDLVSEIDGKYRTIHEKRARAIAGLSMGGYGAVKFAVKYPELFAFAGSLSGAFNAPDNLDDLRPDFHTKLLEVFGAKENPARRENDVFALLKGWHGSAYFYLACGSGDFFLDINRALAAQLSSQKIAYEYHETQGGHAWEYWDSSVTPLLQAAVHALEVNSTLK